jgi:anionic cell wall polymer biosynthesis LytR-Cps2A-Psr (LCP) family protein
MRKWARNIAVALSISIVATSGAVNFFSKAASSAIPRSKALQGAPQSKNGDTNILLIGLDSRRDNEGNPIPREIAKLLRTGPATVGGYNTNTLMLIHIPANGKKAVAVSIPRDNYVNVPGHGMKKIKEAYSYAKYAEDSKLYKEGVKQPLRERLSRDAGRVATIALRFVRQRHGLPNGDLDRTHRQQAFIAGVITKFRTQGIFGDIGKISALLDVAKKDVVIDSGFDVLGFLPQAKALTSGNIKFHTLPIEGYVMRNSQSVNLVDEVKIRKLVQDLFNPKPKDPNAKVTPKPKPTKINYAQLASGKSVDGSKIPCVN